MQGASGIAIRAPNPRVFVVYSHQDKAHQDRVWGLVEALRRPGGIDARFDGYEQSPAQGWPRWSIEQIDAAHFVLVVCSPTLRRRFEGNEKPGQGLGTQWEAKAIVDRIYALGGTNYKFLPVLLDGEPESSIPGVLQHYHYHRVPEAYEGLLRTILGQPLRVPSPLSGRPNLPPAPGPAPVPVPMARPSRSGVQIFCQRQSDDQFLIRQPPLCRIDSGVPIELRWNSARFIELEPGTEHSFMVCFEYLGISVHKSTVKLDVQPGEIRMLHYTTGTWLWSSGTLDVVR